MKCPYQKGSDGKFLECTTDCPACIYEEEEYKEYEKPPLYLTRSERESYDCFRTKIRNVIKGCKFVDNLISPTESSITNMSVHNSQRTTNTTFNSIF